MQLSRYVLKNNIDYTSDQLKAIDVILEWVFKGKDTCFSLRGVAGSGKTTVLSEIVNNIRGSVACSAPTHKAVRIVSKQVGGSPSTIHKLLGLYPNTSLESFNHLSPKFDPRGKKTIGEHKLVIVDEASMIPDSIDRMLRQEATKSGTKVLYVGDPYQLPPIKENGSFYNYMPFMQYKYVELNEIVRQELSNPISKLLSISRNDVKFRTSKAIKYIHKYNNSLLDDKGFLAVRNTSHFEELMLDKFSEPMYLNDIDHVKFLSFTNDEVFRNNALIRSKIIPNAESAIIVKDDLLTSQTSIVDDFSKLVLINSDNYTITKISNFVRQGVNGFLIKLLSFDTSEDTKMFFVVDHTDMKSVIEYYKIFNSYINAAKTAKNPVVRGNNWKKFYEFKNNNLIMNKLEYKGELVAKTDITYGHGLTIHKSQGSTYNNVFINLRDILYTNTGMPYSDIDLRNRLLYVALSRCRDTSFIYY